jgi:hypothetical protein
LRPWLGLTRKQTLFGHVLDEDSAPLTSFTVEVEAFVWDSSLAPAAKDRILKYVGTVGRFERHEGGAFELKDLLPGRYTLIAKTPGRAPARSQMIDLPVRMDLGDVVIAFPPIAVVTGRIVDRVTLTPIAGAAVFLDESRGDGDGGPTPALTRADGTFTLRGVPWEVFSLYLAAPRYTKRTVSGIRVANGSVALKDVTLAPLHDGSPAEEMEGLGVRLERNADGEMVLAKVMVQGPAGQAGLKAKDIIRRVDGKPCVDLTLNQVQELLRGDAGSTTILEVEQDGSPRVVPVKRAVIAL